MSRKTHGAPAGGGAPFAMREYATGPSQRASSITFLDPDLGWLDFSPLELPHNTTAYGIVVFHGAATGNLYVALYDSLNYAPNNRLAVSPNTVASGASQLQYIPFTASVDITANLYFCALEPSNDTDTYMQNINAIRMNLPAGIDNGLIWYRQNLGAYLVPPAAAAASQATTIGNQPLMRLRVAVI